MRTLRFEVVLRHIGQLLIFNTIFLVISAIISIVQKEDGVNALVFTSMISLSMGIFPVLFIPRVSAISAHEGVMISVLGWLVTCLIGSIPFILWGGEFTIAGAIFESVSGYTTTGATVLADVEALPKGLLFWRSSTHFLGGIGIVLFTMLVLSDSQLSRLILVKTEISSIAQQNFKYKARKTIQILFYVYLGLNISQMILLYAFGMSFFDAINHSFATIATGGFSTKNASIAHYNSLAIEIILMVYMILASVHFGLIFASITFQKYNIFTSSVSRNYLVSMLIGTLVTSVYLYGTGFYEQYGHALRHTSFQIISLVSTTGFATVDTGNWPPFTILILLYFMFQCGMVGSTTGGVKFDRVYLFLMSVPKYIKRMQHPTAIIQTKIDKRVITLEQEHQTLLFIVFFVFVLSITTVIISIFGIDLITAFSVSLSSLSNVGPAFGAVTSMGNYGQMPEASKLVLSAAMLLGRLEIFGVISLFFARSWK